MTIGELLLELAGQALLDLVEAGEERNGDKDDNGALAVADFELFIEIVSVLFQNITNNHSVSSTSEISGFYKSNNSYLTGRDELKRSQRRLEVWDVRLEFVEGSSNAGLQLRWVLPRRAVGSDLVECLSRHDCDWSLVNSFQSP